MNAYEKIQKLHKFREHCEVTDDEKYMRTEHLRLRLITMFHMFPIFTIYEVVGFRDG